MDEKSLKPQLRFKGFTDAWEQRKFKEELEIVTDYVAAGSFADLAENVKYRNTIDYAQLIRTTDLKSNFTNKEEIFVDQHAFNFLWRVNLDKEAIVMPNIGNCGEIYYVSPDKLPHKHNVLGPNAILVRSESNDNKFLTFKFLSEQFQKDLKLIISPNGQTKFNKTELKNIIISLPKKTEQSKLGSFFDSLDNLITLHQRKLDKISNVKKALLEKMFPKNDSNVPEIRFKGFTDAWEQRKFKEELEIVTDYVAAGSFADLAENVKYRNTIDYAQLIRTTDLKSNFTNKEEIFVDQHAFNFLWRVNLDKEAIVMPNIGNCGEIYYVSPDKLPHKHNVLGPNAILVRSESNDNKFLTFKFLSEQFQKDLKLIISPNGQTKFNKTELKNIIISLPKKTEQSKLGSFFDSLDNLITLHQRKLEKLKNIKKACLEKMFV